MTIDTNKMVEILKKDKPYSAIMVEEQGKDKLVAFFALPHLMDKIIEFSKTLDTEGAKDKQLNSEE